MSAHIKLTDNFASLLRAALRMHRDDQVDATLLLVDGIIDWHELRSLAGKQEMLVVANKPRFLQGAQDAEFKTVVMHMGDNPVQEQLAQSLLECVANDLLEPGATVAALYPGFEPNSIDSISVIRLDEHLGRLSVRDLRQLVTRVPLETLKLVVDLAVDIGRDGREGKPVGTMFVVGDHRKVSQYCQAGSFDPFRGYNRKERNLDDPRVREGAKEAAVMDGAFIVSADGTIEAGVQMIAAPATGLTLSKGLGSRHWAAAAISRATGAVAVTVSETNGTVRVFQNGEVMLRIEPLGRGMKWRDFEPPTEPKKEEPSS